MENKTLFLYVLSDNKTEHEYHLTSNTKNAVEKYRALYSTPRSSFSEKKKAVSHRTGEALNIYQAHYKRPGHI
jgi:hypothetical protein